MVDLAKKVVVLRPSLLARTRVNFRDICIIGGRHFTDLASVYLTIYAYATAADFVLLSSILWKTLLQPFGLESTIPGDPKFGTVHSPRIADTVTQGGVKSRNRGGAKKLQVAAR